MRPVLKILKVAGIIFLVLIVLIVALLFWLSTRPFVPNNYIQTVDTGGEIEAKYLSMGVMQMGKRWYSSVMTGTGEWQRAATSGYAVLWESMWHFLMRMTGGARAN